MFQSDVLSTNHSINTKLLYTSELKNWYLGGVKAPGLKSKKPSQCYNMNLFFLIQPRELSR